MARLRPHVSPVAAVGRCARVRTAGGFAAAPRMVSARVFVTAQWARAGVERDSCRGTTTLVCGEKRCCAAASC